MTISTAIYADATTALRQASLALYAQWGVMPRAVLACAGGSDEHWQLWHPARQRRGDSPAYTLQGGQLAVHPDAPLLALR